MKVEFLIEEGAEAPSYGSDGASGMDIRAFRTFNEGDRFEKYGEVSVKGHGKTVFGTGVHIKHMEGCEIQVRPRSGLTSRGIIASFGTVDEDYRGEIKITLFNHSFYSILIKKGERIAQLVPMPIIRPEVKIEKYEDESHVQSTRRGDKGFGSTGQF